jgi:hypothetical protein
MIAGNGAKFNYFMDVLVDLDLDFVEFLRRFQYGFYVILFTGYFLLKFVLLDSFYSRKVLLPACLQVGGLPDDVMPSWLLVSPQSCHHLVFCSN